MNEVPESAQTQCERLLAHLKLGMPQVKALRGLDRVCLEDIRK